MRVVADAGHCVMSQPMAATVLNMADGKGCALWQAGRPVLWGLEIIYIAHLENMNQCQKYILCQKQALGYHTIPRAGWASVLNMAGGVAPRSWQASWVTGGVRA